MERILHPSLYAKIKEQTRAHLQATEPDFGEYQNFYVPLSGKRLDSKEEGEDLIHLLETHFLTNDSVGSALLVGSSGAGKTSFSRHWVKQCWDQSEYLDRHRPRIALWIPLLSIEQPKNYLLTKHLETNLNLTKHEIQTFLQSPMQLLVCCDGYDELNTFDNLYPTEVGNHIELKVLYTCRLELLEHQRNYRLSFQPPLTRQKQLLTYELVPFQPTQRINFIEQYLHHNQQHLPEPLDNQPNWQRVDTYLTYFNPLPEIDAFLSHPFSLLMALQALPRIVQEQSATSGTHDNDTNTNQPSSSVLTGKQITLTRQKIYSAFIDKWWDWKIKTIVERKELLQLAEALQEQIYCRQAKKQQRGQSIDPTESNFPETAPEQMEWLKRELNHFTRKLALAMFQRKLYDVTCQPDEMNPVPAKPYLASLDSLSDKPKVNWQARYFANTPNLNLIRRCLPLQRLGPHTYAFLHKSLLEYFAAEHLFNSVIIRIWAEHGKNLDAIRLVDTQDTETLQLLVEQTQHSVTFEQALREMIELSKSEPRIWRAAANAMTLLNYAGKSFYEKDLRRVHIGGETDEERWGADLSGAILDSVDFTDADLRYVRLDRSWLAQAKFNRAIMLGVEFGEWPSLKGKLCCYSPNGQWLAVVEEEGEEGEIFFTTKIALYSTEDYQLEKRFDALHKGDITCLSFSPNNLQLASGSTDYTIRLWDITTGQCQHVLSSEEDSRYDSWGVGSVNTIHYRSDGLQLASSCTNSPRIRLWDVQTGKCQQWLIKAFNSVAYNPKNNFQLASPWFDNQIMIWDVQTGKHLPALKFNDDVDFEKLYLSYSPNGLQLALANRYIWLCDSDTGECQHLLFSHNSSCIDYRPDNLELASGSTDGTITLWDVQTGKSHQVLKGHILSVNSVSYKHDGSQLASACEDNIVRIWDIQKNQHQQLSNSYNDFSFLTHIEFNPNGSQVAIVHYNFIELSDNNNRWQHELEHEDQEIYYIKYSSDGTKLATVSSNKNDTKTIRVWDSLSGQCLQVLELEIEKHGLYDALSIRYYSSGFQLAHTKDNDIRICLLDIQTGKQKQEFQISSDRIDCLSFRQDGSQLAASSDDGTVRLWDIETKKCQAVLHGHRSHITNLCYSPNNLQLASASRGRTIRLWDVATGKCQHVLKGHDYEIENISYSSDSLLLASSDSTISLIPIIRLWNTETGQCIAAIHCTSRIHCLVWQPNISHLNMPTKVYYLIAGFRDLTYKTWKIEQQQNLQYTFRLIKSYPTVCALNSHQLELQSVIDLKNAHYQLLQQRSGNTLRGQPSKADAESIIQQRNQQKYVPSGIISFSHQGHSFKITSKQWLISMVRDKTEQSSAFTSSKGSDTGGHVYLILQGLDEHHYTMVKEFHLRLNTEKVSFFGILGVGTIKVYDSSPWLLKAKQPDLIARQWMISCKDAQALIERIEQQQKSKAPTYSVSGKGGHNCLTWCIKQLEDADIQIDTYPTWRSFICAVPSDYLPEATQENNTNQAKRCLMM